MAKAKLPKRIMTQTGGVLTLDSDWPGKQEETVLQWSVGSGYMYGILPNTPELRKFLRFALKRLEATKPKVKRSKGSIRSISDVNASIRISGFPTGNNLIKALRGDENV